MARGVACGSQSHFFMSFAFLYETEKDVIRTVSRAFVLPIL